MSKLPLALDIADTVTRMVREDEPPDLLAAAAELAAAHPEAEVEPLEVEDVLIGEIAAATNC